ncbi:Uncharacterised protein [uncultured archaeon]|nr:Uncharacterised protein [uncultured archaeon]
MTENKTKRPPSYYKYKKEHPTVSFILNRELKEALDKLKGDKSYGQTVIQIIESKVNPDLSKQIKEMQEEISILNKQSEFLRGLQRFEVPCAKCGEPMNITSNDKNWHTKVIPRLRNAFRDWGHLWNCPNEK